MTTSTDIANMALDEIGAKATIASLADPSKNATTCARHYDILRRNLLRAVHWGFARRTLSLTQVGAYTNVPPDNIYPWAYSYAYPADCIKVRYLLNPPPPTPIGGVAPPVGQPIDFAPWLMPSRTNRFVVSVQTVGSASPPDTQTLILANLQSAVAVYTMDVINVGNFDPLFIEALTMALASKIVIPLTGNVNMKKAFVQLAQQALITAQVADGNESLPKTDHTPDWIKARGTPASAQMSGVDMLGNWFASTDSMSWGD